MIEDPKTLMSVKEKTSFVFVLIIAFVLGIIGAVIDIKNLGVNLYTDTIWRWVYRGYTYRFTYGKFIEKGLVNFSFESLSRNPYGFL